MENFNWCIRPDYSIESKPRIYKSQFGDGYVQRSAVGIHGLLRKYPVTVKLHKEQAKQVDLFLSKHKGVEPFYFVEPLSGQKKKVVCEHWTIRVGRRYAEISCEFEETP